MKHDPHWLTRQQAAEELNVSLPVVDRLRRAKQLRSKAFGEGGKCVRIHRTELDRFIKQRSYTV